MKLWLDDQWDDTDLPDRHPPEGWTPIKTARQAIKLLKSHQISHIDLDHDLGAKVYGNGMLVLKWIQKQVIKYNYTPPVMTIHSMNSGAARDMIVVINRINFLVNPKF